MSNSLLEYLHEPGHLPVERASKLMGAISDHEIKALALIAMHWGEGYSGTSLRQEILGHCEHPENIAMVDDKSVSHYLEDSFEKKGIVIRYDVPKAYKFHPRNKERYLLNREGFCRGRAFAGQVLNLSIHTADDVSLRRLNGMTHSRIHDEGPPYHRYEILKLLQEVDIATVPEMAISLGAHPNSIKQRVAALKRDQLVMANKVAGKRYQTIMVNPDAELVVQQTVAIVDGLIANKLDFVREGHEMADDILGNEEAIRYLVQKGRDNSPQANNPYTLGLHRSAV